MKKNRFVPDCLGTVIRPVFAVEFPKFHTALRIIIISITPPNRFLRNRQVKKKKIKNEIRYKQITRIVAGLSTEISQYCTTEIKFFLMCCDILLTRVYGIIVKLCLKLFHRTNIQAIIILSRLHKRAQLDGYSIVLEERDPDQLNYKIVHVANNGDEIIVDLCKKFDFFKLTLALISYSPGPEIYSHNNITI